MKPCPIKITNQVISGKWKAQIIFKLGNKKYGFNELQKRIGNITPRSLSLALKNLEENQIINRHVLHEEVPIKVEYSLTDLGYTLFPIITDMYHWGEIYLQR